jgi:hypothetical protein
MTTKARDGNASKKKASSTGSYSVKKETSSCVNGGIIGQAGVPPSGTQYKSDRIPPAYAKRESTKSK